MGSFTISETYFYYLRCFSLQAMTDHISTVTAQYQRQMLDTFHPPSFYGVTRLDADGVVTKLFLSYLFCDKEKAYAVPEGHWIDSHRYDVQKCGLRMQWCAEPQLKEGYRWYCHRGLLGPCAHLPL